MTLPISERVMAAVATQLATITTGNGYSITANVLRSTRTVTAKQLPAVVLWDAGEAATDASGSYLGMKMTLSLEVVVFVLAEQGDTGTQLETAKADVKKALLAWAKKGVRDDAGQIGPLTYDSATLQPREDGDQTESVSLKFSCNYAEGYGDPTANAGPR